MHDVDVGLPLPAALDGYETGGLQFSNELGNARACQTHVVRQLLLTRETEVVVPAITGEHRINDLGANGEPGIAQDEIWQLCEALLGDRIDAIELYISARVCELGGDVLHRPTKPVYIDPTSTGQLSTGHRLWEGSSGTITRAATSSLRELAGGSLPAMAMV